MHDLFSQTLRGRAACGWLSWRQVVVAGWRQVVVAELAAGVMPAGGSRQSPACQ